MKRKHNSPEDQGYFPEDPDYIGEELPMVVPCPKCGINAKFIDDLKESELWLICENSHLLRAG